MNSRLDPKTANSALQKSALLFASVFSLCLLIVLAAASFSQLSVTSWVLQFLVCPALLALVMAHNRHLQKVQGDWKLEFFVVLIFGVIMLYTAIRLNDGGYHFSTGDVFGSFGLSAFAIELFLRLFRSMPREWR